MSIISRIPMVKHLLKPEDLDEAARTSLVLETIDHTPQEIYPAEIVRSLRQMITRLGRSGELPERLAVTAALRHEGVSYISRALAAVMANDLDVKVGLIELNWWWPSEVTAKFYGPGLAQAVAGKASAKEVLVPTGRPNLFLAPAGRAQRAQRPIIARSQALKDTISELNKQCDYLILDTPAVLATSDAIPLASLAESCCIVIRQGVTKVTNVREALDEIDHLQVLGIVMNQVSIQTPRSILNLIPQN